MPTLRINEVNYYYEQHGQGTALVLIAGYACDHTYWHPLLSQLSSDFQSYVFDNRAVGQTTDDGQAFSLECMADETAALIQALKIEKPILIGHSMGGIIAQILAAKNPQLIQQLIILNASEKISKRTLMVLDNFVALLNAGISIETVIDACMPWFFSEKFLSDEKNHLLFRQMILQNPFPQTRTDLLRQLKALHRFKVSKKLPAIEVPTLIMSAKEDLLCLPEESHRLAQKMPHAKEWIISAGHASPLEAPEEIAQAIRTSFC